jgi:hypothetical protein
MLIYFFLKNTSKRKFTIKVNGQLKPVQFYQEMEGDVLICYFKIKDIHKIKSLEIYNALITENEQQNIIFHFRRKEYVLYRIFIRCN